MSLAGHAVKRLFDITLSALLLVIFSPVMLLCALAIRLEDGEPVIYRQERIGRGGKPFDILKFRSMRKDAENGSPALWSGEDDPRLTKVGRFLRRHHLDELPQLWNVFRGDMSFIGYRPERQYYIEQIMERNPRYRYLYQIRPGVTSYATLYNGYTDTLQKMLTRLDLDLYYLRNHSVMFDLKVLGLTFLGIVSGRKF
jgi:lipopolysaccharide/colanic/teichoic acid biosynthesis glycosyltransferase